MWCIQYQSRWYMAVSKNSGPHFGSSYNKSPTILGYILGPLIFGVSHMGHNAWYMGAPKKSRDPNI